MSDRARQDNRRQATDRVIASRLRRTVVTAMAGVLAIGVGTVGALFVAGSATASAPAPGWTGTQSPIPAGIDTPAANPGELITTVACASAVSCVAAGSYEDASAHHHGMLDILSGASWSAVEAPLPSDANADPGPSFTDGVCPTSGSCVVVGDNANSVGTPHTNGLIETMSGGVWNATEAPLPSDAAPASSANTVLTSVSCPAPGSCVAVGYYNNTGGNTVGLVDTLSGGTWTPTPAPQVSDANTNKNVQLAGISCPALGSCQADGKYTTNAGGKGLELLSLSGGAWTPSVAPLPSDTATGAAN